MRRGSFDEASAAVRPHLRSLAQRRRSAPTLVFGKALGMPWSPIREEARCVVAVEQSPFVLGLTGENSQLILHECVRLMEGVKSRERHLFLFSDVLVIAKLKSVASYRLKYRVNLEEVWVYGFEGEDEEMEEEVDFDLKSSVVLAWPLTFCVVSFCLPEVKELWLETLHRRMSDSFIVTDAVSGICCVFCRQICEARERTRSFPLTPSIPMKLPTANISAKTLTGGGMDSLIELPLDGDGKSSAVPKQLCNQGEQVRQPIENGVSTVNKRKLFPFLKRSSTQTGLAVPSETESKNLLFGVPLSKLCSGDESSLPKPILEVLSLLWRKGPNTEGVFRKTGNSKTLNTIRDQLNTGVQVDLATLPVVLLVGLLKSFLRELPGSLLQVELSKGWMSALEKENVPEKHADIMRVVDKLPSANCVLLRHLLCLLHHISQSSDINKMDTRNLAVCIAPTLLQSDSLAPDVDMVEKVTILTQYLIENCTELFGEQILTLLGDPEEEELGENSDSLSSHQQDSAYDSTDPDPDPNPDPDADPDPDSGDATGRRLSQHSPLLGRTEHSNITSCSSDAIFQTFTTPFSRRCSEPSIFPSAAMGTVHGLARSFDDFSRQQGDFDDHPLKKQNSDDSLLHPYYGARLSLQPLRRLGGSLNMDLPGSSAPASKVCSCSSSCSLESGASNISEGSMFTSSPLASPPGLQRSQSAKQVPVPARPRSDLPKAEGDVKRRSQSFKTKGFSSFSFSRSSTKKAETQKEIYSCDTLPEDSQSEMEEVPRRQRPLSAIEVFQHVDSRLPSSPPSYEQALEQRGSMTVQAAMEAGRRSRPISMNETLLNSCFVGHLPDGLPRPAEDGGAVSPRPAPFRQRAMSESVPHLRHEQVARRCSQPVFEEFSYAKESYV
ncbi:T cell activation RhoGTPase activating protein b [Chanos chanos]|uniref:T cell activation RhoGTPase activating protein b n=1 Tax=Chanos chanos TaxID=29144 RepID=A0A6J2W2G3_CHACN|nr:T-cell activation Rho GTPase-activating protein-like [Chanos chanos]